MGRPRIRFESDTERTCSRCRETLPIACFRKNKSVSGGFNRYCKQCQVDHGREDRQKKVRRAIEYLGGKCERCCGVFHPDVYDFHHRNPKEKEFSINSLRKGSWDKMKKELDKCALLCANCHRLTHAEERDVGV